MRRFILIFLFLILFPVPLFAGTASSITYSRGTGDPIVWTFDQAYTVGTFANGDPWVLGPVTITAISPVYDAVNKVNGWMVNPVAGEPPGYTGSQGFMDSTYLHFDATLIPSLPYTSPSSGITSVMQSVPRVPASTSIPLQKIGVLTIVSETPPDNGTTCFRPPYAGASATKSPSGATYYRTTSVLTNQLLNVVTPVTANLISWAYLENQFMMPQIDLGVNGTEYRHLKPKDNMGYNQSTYTAYGPDITVQHLNALAKLNAFGTLEDKTPTLIYVIQAGIDFHHSVLTRLPNPTDWEPAGNGEHINQKVIIAYAAYMLNNQAMKDHAAATYWYENTTCHDALWMIPDTEVGYWWKAGSYYGSTLHFGDPYRYIDGSITVKYRWDAYLAYIASLFKQESTLLREIPALKTIWGDADNFVTFAERWESHGVKSLPDPCAPVTRETITSVTTGNPTIITRNSHSVQNGDKVRLWGLTGITDNERIATVTGANTFTIPVLSTSVILNTSGMLSRANLAIGVTTLSKVASSSFSYTIADVTYYKAATETIPGNDIVPATKYGAVALDIDAAGTITVIEAADNATGYTTAALAIAGIPAKAADVARMGTISAKKSIGNFTFGTTLLNNTLCTISYTDNINSYYAYGNGRTYGSCSVASETCDISPISGLGCIKGSGRFPDNDGIYQDYAQPGRVSLQMEEIWDLYEGAETYFSLTITKAGDGSGTVTTSPSGIDCGDTCVAAFVHDTVVTITATPVTNSSVVLSGSGCSGTGPCDVTLSEARDVTATFTDATPTYYTVRTTWVGDGTTDPPAGDREILSGETDVTTQTPGENKVFAGWAGTCGCTGTEDCSAVITADCDKIATWVDAQQFLLTVTYPTNGETVMSDSGLVNCGGVNQVCARYHYSGTVTLTGTCADYWYNGVYSGDCSGSTCALNMTADKSVGFGCTNGRAITLGVGGTITGIGTGGGVITIGP